MNDPDSLKPALLGVASLIVLMKAWHGWRIGVVRQAVGLLALAVAVGAAILGGPVVGPMLAPVLAVPTEALAGFGGLALGLAVYLVITLVSAVLFKKTEHQSVGVIRLGYGLAGAALGAIVGFLLAVVLLTAFFAATGRPEIVEHLRRGEFQKALDSVESKPDNPRPKPPRASRR